jgi:hypothetical protein
LSSIQAAVWIEEGDDAALEDAKNQIDVAIAASCVQQHLVIDEIVLELSYPEDGKLSDPPKEMTTPCAVVGTAAIIRHHRKKTPAPTSSRNLRWRTS